MRLTSVRFTIRQLMLAVAILGVSIELLRRHDQFLRRAEYHEASVSITLACGPGHYSATNELGEDVRSWSLTRIEWHHRLGEKYRRAASSPWLPVEPDPPQPI